ncbi:amidohydrolase family protein [Emticicia sp. CRIBPO]|uniref:amidohydrolase family protein n=1 Tax=Emticicia sp. CRIBPO TaxID=2683258 RepID=UPI001412E4F3|nr:amidohydrolase family protein [Emticicia sp. CRIBPO]NBA87605.1 amidohydrolase family protein [Emticicia sp. CRIBPO]
MKRILKYILAAHLAAVSVSMAQNPAVGKASSKAIVISGAEIHVGNGTVIPNGTIVIEKGLIKEVGASVSNIPADAVKIDAKGKRVYPGIISPNSTLGLNEIASVRATTDFSEIGSINPNIRSLIAYNTDSEVIPTVRGNGVLISQATPEGGLISGRSSIMNHDGWNWEDAVLKADDGVWLSWPARVTASFDFATMSRENKKNPNYANVIRELDGFFTQAEAYKAEAGTTANIKLEAMQAVLKGNARLYIQVEKGKEIIDAIRFCKSHKIKYPVIVGAVSSTLAIDAIKENNIPVLLPTTHRLPDNGDDEVWEAYKLPAKLFAKGILTGMYYNESYWRTRNLPFVAGSAAAHGLSKGDALKMITENNAKILGIDNVVGTLEKGKQATLFISAGDILDMMTAKVEKAFIKGAEISLDDKQKRLYKKYADKYGIE